MTDTEKLNNIRQNIDEIDCTIQQLINKRAEYAINIAQIKRNIEGSNQCYRPEREAQVLKMISERNQGPLPNKEVARLFREIMSACLALEEPMNIAYLGPEGTFTQEATLKHFGHSIKAIPKLTIDEIFHEVTLGSASYGVVPIENSTEGTITHTLDMFINSPLHICGEVDLRIHHNLLSNTNKLKDIKTVYAHPQALAQCHKWLNENLPHATRESVSSNAEAARKVAKIGNDAAIASSIAAKLYKLNIAIRNIENEPNNTTRFLIIGCEPVVLASGKDKTSVMVSAMNKSGTLVSLLQPFAEQRISMTRLESRPSHRGNWEYIFFFDIEGHECDEPVQKALTIIRKTTTLRILGSYPKAAIL